MPRLAEYILTQALPYIYRLHGFRVYQENQKTLILEHHGNMVDSFPSDIEYHILVSACKEHMIKEHGYMRGSI